MDALHADLVFFMILLVAALGVGMLAERVRVPYTVLLFLASAPLSVPNLPFRFDPSLLTVFLPALVFEAAWNLDQAALRRTWGAVALLAGPGVIVTAIIVGMGLSAMRLLPAPQALLLGVILAATDPVAVIAVFRRLKIPLHLTTLIEAESLFNDGVVFVAYGAVVGAIMAGSSGAELVTWSANAVMASINGVIIGIAVALLLAWTLRIAVDPLLHIVTTLVAA